MRDKKLYSLTCRSSPRKRIDSRQSYASNKQWRESCGGRHVNRFDNAHFKFSASSVCYLPTTPFLHCSVRHRTFLRPPIPFICLRAHTAYRRIGFMVHPLHYRPFAFHFGPCSANVWFPSICGNRLFSYIFQINFYASFFNDVLGTHIYFTSIMIRRPSNHPLQYQADF